MSAVVSARDLSFLETSRSFNAVISKDQSRLIELVVSENQCIQVLGCVRPSPAHRPGYPFSVLSAAVVGVVSSKKLSQ